MRIDAGLDTGEVLLKWETEIGPEENALELSQRLAAAGAQLLVRTLNENPSGVKQDSGEATLAPILKKEDGLIDWSWPAQKISNRVRGFLPWPGAYSYFRGQGFHIWKARVGGEPGSGNPGHLRSLKKRLLIDCGAQTALEALEVQIEGRRRMAAEAFLNGQHLNENETLGEQSMGVKPGR